MGTGKWPKRRGLQIYAEKATNINYRQMSRHPDVSPLLPLSNGNTKMGRLNLLTESTFQGVPRYFREES